MLHVGNSLGKHDTFAAGAQTNCSRLSCVASLRTVSHHCALVPYSTIRVCVVCLYVRTVGHCKLRQLIKIEVAAASGATQGKAAEARNDGDDGKNAAQLIYYAERARGAL